MCSNRRVTEARTSETKLEFPYSRTTGPVVGAFLRALSEGRLLAIRDRGGRAIVPPLEYDPQTGETLERDLVDVGPAGTVVAWTWVDEPLPKHPLNHPFAFALIQPDGADTSILHAVDAGGVDAMSTGMRVTPRFAPEPKGLITDLEAWEPARP